LKVTALFLTFCLSICASFAQKKPTATLKTKTNTYKQVCGIVTKLIGNLQPDPDARTSTAAGVIREILVYKLTKAQANSQATATGFHTIKSGYLKKTKSDKNGNYCLWLRPGQYTILINEPGMGKFANNYDAAMNINPLIVTTKKNAAFDIEINYSATY
jgi:hypothetical protein